MLRAMTQEEARAMVRRRVAEQFPNLFPPTPPREVLDPQAEIRLFEERAYALARQGPQGLGQASDVPVKLWVKPEQRKLPE